jgi:hypothetical protein
MSERGSFSFPMTPLEEAMPNELVPKSTNELTVQDRLDVFLKKRSVFLLYNRI